MRKDSQECIQEFESCYRSLDRRPDDPKLWERMGDILHGLTKGRDNDVRSRLASIAPDLTQEKCWKHVVGFDPDRAVVWAKLAVLYLLVDDYHRALFPLRMFTSRRPDDVSALCHLGQCLRGLAAEAADNGNWEEHDETIQEAEELFLRALEIDEKAAKKNDVALMLDEIAEIKKRRIRMRHKREA
jgi:tetratricopeptide (TPR) repeat protein